MKEQPEGSTFDLRSLLGSEDRDFLIRSNGDQVKISSLQGKSVGILFSSSMDDPTECEGFITLLAEVYKELSSWNADFEVVLIPGEILEYFFNAYFSGENPMPWLAVPFSGVLDFGMPFGDMISSPSLVVLDANGKVVTMKGVDMVNRYRGDVYPFTEEKVREMEEEAMLQNPTIEDIPIVKIEGATFDLRSLLGSEDRDFLIRSNGDQVKISSLQGKSVGLLFSCSMAPMLCDWFIPLLAQVYKELSIWNADFEIVMVPCEMSEEYFTAYFSGEMPMPWLAVPFSGRDLGEPFGNASLPSLVVLDANGKVVTTKGVELANRYRGAAYPFTEERVRELEEEEAAMLQNPTIENMLISGPIDFVLSGDGNKVHVSELQGKTVAIYLTNLAKISNNPLAQELLDMYMKLKEIGEKFELVAVSTETELEPFEQGLAGTAWLTVPYRFSTNIRLLINFYDDNLVIIGPDGKLLCRRVSNVVENHGIDAYPFTPEKLEELAQHDKAKIESQTLESLLVSGELDYVIGKDDLKVPVSQLVGMNILFYFSRKNGALTELLPVLIKAYRNIKERGNSFEIIFVSEDTDEESFDDLYSQMPWLALPFGDARKKPLKMAFNKPGDSDLVVVGPNGETVAARARRLVCSYGAAAFPFTKQREEVEVAKSWPERINFYHYREYELVKIYNDKLYLCGECYLDGTGWQYWDEDKFRVHPRCALPENEEMNGTYEEDGGGEEEEQVE